MHTGSSSPHCCLKDNPDHVFERAYAGGGPDQAGVMQACDPWALKKTTNWKTPQ